MKRPLALLELFARTSGAAAAALAIPLFGGIGLAAAILFAGNGLSARDVIALERASFAVRAALWTGWIVLSVPPARTLLGAPSARWVRSLPVGRAALLALLLGGLVALQAPWIVLFARDRGALAGLGAGLLAAALAAGGAAFRAMRAQAAALLLPVVAIALPLPLAPSIALGLVPCVLAANAGFFRGIALPQGGLGLVRGPAPVALAGVLVARLARSERVAVLRALLAAAAGGVLGAVGARNNQRLDEGFPWFVLPVATLPLVIGASVVAGPIVRAEASLSWLLDATAVRARTRVAARFLASLLAGALPGLAAGAAAVLVARPPLGPAIRAALALGAWGACLGALASFVARRSARTGKREGGVVLTGLSGLGIASLLTASFLDAPALLLAPLAVLAAAAADTWEARRR
jgi:hypothetical protein